MIVCVGLTPTVQRTLCLTRLVPGEVNRARRAVTTASGKAVNVARTLTRLGASVLLHHPLGGDSGRYLAAALEAQGIRQEILWTADDAPTRTCTTVLSDDGAPATELVEESPPLRQADADRILRAVRENLGEATALCLCGSLPRGVEEGFYAALVREAAEHDIPTLVDAQQGPLRAALREGPWLVKPNVEEAQAALALPRGGDRLADAGAAIDALTAAGANWALVTAGRDGALLGFAGSPRTHALPPPIEALNPIGSGDALAAGLLFAHFIQGESLPDALAFGTACAAANCLTLTSGEIDPHEVQRLLPQVQITERGL